MPSWITWIIDNGYVWLAISLFAAMFVTQWLKQIVKAHGSFIPRSMRRGVIFALAAGTGYSCGLYFLTDTGIPHAEKWSVVVALFNPGIYIALVAYAARNKRLWLLAILKQRPIKEDSTGVENHNDTQVYMRGEE